MIPPGTRRRRADAYACPENAGNAPTHILRLVAFSDGRINLSCLEKIRVVYKLYIAIPPRSRTVDGQYYCSHDHSSAAVV